MVAAPVRVYINRQRRRLESRADALNLLQRSQMEGYWGREVLDCARVVIANPLPIPDLPFASLIRRLGFDFASPSQTEAITFDNVIACRTGLSDPVLFHELVHVVQYRILGVAEFARQYVAGFMETRSYFEIPLERCAFDLQARFEGEAQPFDVESEVRRRL